MTYLRDYINDEYGTKELQEKILEIAVYIDKLCEENNITYFLMGGSALGALRHNGFIPWDDDLDIFMKPTDYEKFKKVFNDKGDKESYYLQELMKCDEYVSAAKLRMNGTTYIEEATKDWKIHHGIFVDIFILHNASNTFIESIGQCLSAKYVLMKGQSYKKTNYTGIKKIACLTCKILPGKLGIHSSLKKIYKYDNIHTKNVCHFMGKAFFNEGIYSSEYFSSAKRVDFEKIQLNVPIHVHEYLKQRFGNYMVMPDKTSIKKAQHALKWDTRKDFSCYVNKQRDFSDEYKLV